MTDTNFSNSFNAQDWAKTFCDKTGNKIDEGWMIAWFANAIMRGFDEREPEITKLKKIIKLQEKMLDLSMHCLKDYDPQNISFKLQEIYDFCKEIKREQA